jgi:carbon storage regulator
MLILTRRISEQIVVKNAQPNDIIIFEVLGIRGNQTRIGATAPKHVTIHRREIQDKIDSSQLRTSLPAPREDRYRWGA